MFIDQKTLQVTRFNKLYTAHKHKVMITFKSSSRKHLYTAHKQIDLTEAIMSENYSPKTYFICGYIFQKPFIWDKKGGLRVFGFYVHLIENNVAAKSYSMSMIKL